ncbi:MAG: hypothetical protein ACJAUY_001640 [Cognaticolwellia sp.]|jgi:hypothetical protein
MPSNRRIAMDIDEYKSIVLSYEQDIYVPDYADPDPNDFINEVSGEIFAESEDGFRELVGKFKLYYVDINRSLDNGINAFDVFDSHTQELYDYYTDLFDGNEFSEKLRKRFNDIYDLNLLILDRLEIVSSYRGNNW